MERMEKESENRLIDRYINGTLTGVERKDFIDRMEQDVKFRDRVVFRNAVVDGIKTAANQKVKTAILANINYRKPLIPFGLKLLSTFIFIVAVSILFWNYLGTNQQALKFNWFKFRSNGTVQRKYKPEKIQNEVMPELPITASNDSVFPTDSILGSESIAGDSLSTAGGEIVVRKDQMISSMNVLAQQPALQKNTVAKDNNLTQETVQRLNPSAGLPNEDNAAMNFRVEFWESPVNYRGYKRSGNTIQLYGVEPSDDVVLYLLNNRLVLHIGQEYYELRQGDSFQPYHVIKESELSLFN